MSGVGALLYLTLVLRYGPPTARGAGWLTWRLPDGRVITLRP